jgi:hypothetical protein
MVPRSTAAFITALMVSRAMDASTKPKPGEPTPGHPVDLAPRLGDQVGEDEPGEGLVA